MYSNRVPGSYAKKNRKLDIGRIKGLIVSVAGGITAFFSALTGLGAQVALAPMLTWMLGFTPEKALATSFCYATFITPAILVGVVTAHAAPAMLLLRGVLLFLAATVGALLSAPVAVARPVVSRRRSFQTVGIVLTLFVIIQTSRVSAWGPAHSYIAAWNQPWQLGLLGLAVGALTQILALPSGILLVPCLYYLAGIEAKEAILDSLMVVALAAALPAWSYARRGLVDSRFSRAAIFGGILGGVMGGLALGSHAISNSVVLYVFAVVGMFLCARELARTAIQPGPRA